jgi:hypothetical protein
LIFCFCRPRPARRVRPYAGLRSSTRNPIRRRFFAGVLGDQAKKDNMCPVASVRAILCWAPLTFGIGTFRIMSRLTSGHL